MLTKVAASSNLCDEFWKRELFEYCESLFSSRKFLGIENMLPNGVEKEKVPMLSFSSSTHVLSRIRKIWDADCSRLITCRTRRHQNWFAFRTNDNAQPDSELTWKRMMLRQSLVGRSMDAHEPTVSKTKSRSTSILQERTVPRRLVERIGRCDVLLGFKRSCRYAWFQKKIFCWKTYKHKLRLNK